MPPPQPNTSTHTDGSRTITLHDAQPRPEGEVDESGQSTIPQVTLRLRGGPRSRPRVAWDERVVDNENCGRKKSKICCIYHKPRPFDESSDESSSDSNSDSDSAPSDDGRARPHHSHRNHHHHPTDGHPGEEGDFGLGSGLRDPEAGSSAVHELKQETDKPNAYESQPLHLKKGKSRAKA